MRIILSKILLILLIIIGCSMGLTQPIYAAGQTDWQRFVEYNQDRFQLILPGSPAATRPFDPDIALGNDYDLDAYFMEENTTTEIDRIVIDLPAATPEPKVHLAVAVSPQIQPIVTQPSNLDPLFEQYAAEYGLSTELLKSIAQCESGLNAGAVNGPYGGMFQFTSGTWISNRQAMGLATDPSLRFDGEEAIKTAAFKMSRDGIGAWPACGKRAIATLEFLES